MAKSLFGLIIFYTFNVAFLYQLFASLLVFIAIKLLLFYRARLRRYKLFNYYNIPGPKANLINGNWNLYTKNENTCLIDEENLIKYGKTFAYFIGDEPRLISTDLELLRHVFLQNLSPFRPRMDWMIKGPLDDSLVFLSDHTRWLAIRRAMTPSFTSYQLRGSESSQFIEDTLKSLIEFIEEKFSIEKNQTQVNNSDGKNRIQINILNLMKAVALQMVSHMAVPMPNVGISEEEKNVKALDELFTKAAGGIIDMLYTFPFLKRIVEFLVMNVQLGQALVLKQCINGKVSERLAQLKSEQKQQKHSTSTSSKLKNDSNLIEKLIRHHYEGRLSREEVNSNCLAVLTAGYDTTATTLTYIFWNLAKHSDIQERLRLDLATYGCESVYLEQVIDETMRLYPTVTLFTSRKATKTVQFNGLTIPQGTRVIYNSWLIHRDPQLWPNPLEFDPDRFKPGSEMHPCAFAPFGLGARKCIGYQLAKLELRMVVCDIILRYKIQLISPNQLDLISYSYFLTKPKEKVILEFEKL